MTPLSALEAAVLILGGQNALASALGPPVTQAHVWYWIHKGLKLPAPHCLAVERLTGGKIKAHELRPDVFKPPRKTARKAAA